MTGRATAPTRVGLGSSSSQSEWLAGTAEQELPDQVDADRVSGPLSRLGLDPQELLGKLGGGGLGGLLGGR